MATFCIPPVLAERLKAAAQRGEIDIEQMYNMTSEGRRNVFSQYVDADIAQKINLGFEKAMVSSKVDSLKKWADATFTGSEALKKKKTTILDRITELNESGILTPEKETEFYQDLVAEKLGLVVTPEEATQLTKFAEDLQSKQDVESAFGTPNLEYFQARRKMQDYIESLTPSSKLKVFSSIISRGNMLLRASSPILNIESNTIMGATQAFARRLETRSVGGVNNKYALDYQKFALDVYRKTGYDITRMMAIEDDLTVRGEDIVTSQGTGKVRKIGRLYEDVVFKTMQGLPDVVYAGFAASDRANIESTKIARNEGLKGQESKARALEIFKDATRIDPRTPEGIAVRNSALADAMYSTYTNKSVYGDISLGIRKVLNIASGDLRLGDQLMPFVKTPANVVGTGLNMSGIGVPIDATYRMFQVLSAIKKGETFTEAMQSEFSGFWRTMVQAGIGLTFAHILSSLFDPEDFIGEYPVSEKERQLLDAQNATTNSVKIGNRWVSLDYFGPLGAPMTGMLYAKKYGRSMPDSFYQYIKGTVAQSAKLPGLENAGTIVDYLQGLSRESKRTVNDEIRDMAAYALGFVQSRFTPGIVYDIARMTDTVERKTDKGDMFDKVRNAFPGLRQTLPEKKTIFNDTKRNEPAWSILLFGSRIKTARQNAINDELIRLDTTGNLPSITDVSKTSPRAKALKEQIGQEKYDEAMDLFASKFRERTEALIARDAYKRASDERKSEAITKMKNDLFEAVLRKYGYKKPKE